MKKRLVLTNLYELFFAFVDIVLVIFSIYVAYAIRFGSLTPPRYNYDPFIRTVPFTIVIYLIFMYIYGLVDIIKQSISQVIYSIFLTVIMLFMATTVTTYFMGGYSYPRLVIAISTVIQFVLLSIWKCIVWKIIMIKYERKAVLIIGENNAEHAAKKIILEHSDLYKIKYISSSYYEYIDDLIEKVDIVIICDDVPFGIKDHVLDLCLVSEKNVLIVPSMSDISLLGSKLNKVDDLPLLKVKQLNLTVEERIMKRIIDLILALTGFIITSPIMILAAILIKVSDGGNIFYTQERVTEGGRCFNIIKFRSMKMNAEKLSGPVLASEQDPRITRLGRIIRATRIDELPQIINIIKGDMSIVGPRPERPFYVDKFETEIADYKYRTIVKAGLTGLAQVQGKYNTTPEDKVRYDIIYIKNYSIILDIKLILQTIKIVFMKESTEGVKEEMSLDKLITDRGLDIRIYKKS